MVISMSEKNQTHTHTHIHFFNYIWIWLLLLPYFCPKKRETSKAQHFSFKEKKTKESEKWMGKWAKEKKAFESEL